MSEDQRYTLRDLLLISGDSIPRAITLELIFAKTHEAFERLVEKAIEWIAQEFAKTAQVRFELSEDELSIELVTNLKAMGFFASHDTAYGGHGDIIIEQRGNFLWLGEAKIHTGYDWLLKGFQQLDTRYSTGLPGQDTGSMIIYCKQPRIDNIMVEWARKLVEARPDVDVLIDPQNSLFRRSTHPHVRTGRPFRVRHVPISVYFKPDDKRQ